MRRLIAGGREQEVQEIREFISTIVLDPDAHTRESGRDLCDNRSAATSISIDISDSPESIRCKFAGEILDNRRGATPSGPTPIDPRAVARRRMGQNRLQQARRQCCLPVIMPISA